ncbi:alcohol oxidase [Fusarium bulbicola]|nr:alcohol oxidase [Fusarium bulbicola]
MAEEDPTSSVPRDHHAPLPPFDAGPFTARAPRDEEPFEAWEQGLGFFDIFSLIVNKMIGTGIYTSPTAVFLLTGNKSLTLGLFAVGFFYCLMSTAIYLQFAEVLPYNGGELVYLDEVTSHVKPDPANTIDYSSTQEQNGEPLTETNGPTIQNTGGDRLASNLVQRLAQLRRKLLGDGLLAHIIYSLMFIVFFNSATNSLQFGRMVLMCINAHKDYRSTSVDEDDDTVVDGDDVTATNIDADVNHDLMRFIGVTILSIICLAQFFFPSWGRKLNKFLAVVKIGFLIGVIIVALAALSNNIEDIKGNTVPRAQDWLEWYGNPSKVQFAKALLAVLFSFEGWENATFVSFVPLITLQPGSHATVDVMLTTAPLVKQVIGQAEVLPWSRYLKQDDCIKRTETPRADDFHYRSPQGGLIAHWLFTVLMIGISASIKSTLESVGLPGYIQTYTHCFILMVLGLGSLNLRSRQKALSVSAVPPNRTGSFFDAFVLVSTPFYTGLNLTILVVVAIPPYKSSDLSGDAFPGWGFSTIVASVLVLGTIYYLLFFGAACRSYEPLVTNDGSDEEGSRSRVYSGILSPQSRWNLMQYAGVECQILKDYSYKELERVYRFGRRWEIIYGIKGVDDDGIYPSIANIIATQIIVGGGTAGGALATRLSLGLPKSKILLLEAGLEALDDVSINVPGMRGSILGSSLDWNFSSIAQPGLNGRSISVNRGKVLGGSSAMDFLCYDRAASAEYDAWSELGSPGWNWDTMIDGMKKSENFTGNDGDVHGRSGPISSTYNRIVPDVLKPWQSTVNKLGVPINDGGSLGGNPIGVMFQPTNIEVTNYTRSYSANSYLPKAGPSLKVKTNAHVAKVLFSSNKSKGLVATGVALQDGSTIKARREVILSTGSIQSPGLLEMSGIGQAEVLARAGIKQLLDLRGVGENYQDHLRTSNTYILKEGYESFDQMIFNPEGALAKEQFNLWLENKVSWYDYTSSAYAFLNWAQASDDVQKKMNQLAKDGFATNGTVVDKKKLEYLSDTSVPQLELLLEANYVGARGYPGTSPNFITIFSSIMHPMSRGSVHINGQAVKGKPIIDLNYLNNEYDIQALIEGARFTRKVAETDPLRSVWAAEFEPGLGKRTDAQLRDWAVKTVNSFYHPVGTCAMLPKKDGGLVDANLKVYGTNNLRVVDASIVPVQLSGHIQTAVYGIAETAAQNIIAAEHKYRKGL